MSVLDDMEYEEEVGGNGRCFDLLMSSYRRCINTFIYRLGLIQRSVRQYLVDSGAILAYGTQLGSASYLHLNAGTVASLAIRTSGTGFIVFLRRS